MSLRRIVVPSLLAAALLSLGLTPPAASAGTSPTVLGWGLSPVGAAVVGANLWVLNDSDELVELSATTGAYERTVLGYQPIGVAGDGSNLWLLESASVLVELNGSSGATEQVIDPASDGLGDPSGAIAVVGGSVWLAGDSPPELLQLDATTGAELQALPLSSADAPGQLAAQGADLWVLEGSSSPSLVELDGATGGVLHSLTGLAADCASEGDESTTPVLAVGGPDVYWGYTCIPPFEDEAWSGEIDSFDTTTDGDGPTYSGTLPFGSDEYQVCGVGGLVASGGLLWVSGGIGTSCVQGVGQPFPWLSGLVGIRTSTGTIETIVRSANAGVQVPDGADLWADNDAGGLVKLSTTGNVLARSSTSHYGLRTPEALAAVGDDVWVLNQATDALEELNATTHAIVRKVDLGGRASADEQYPHFDTITVSGDDLWVQNLGDLSEVDAATGARLRTIPVITSAVGAAVTGGHVWTADGCPDPSEANRDHVKELSASSGRQLRNLDAASLDLRCVDAVLADGPDVWVLSWGCEVSSLSIESCGSPDAGSLTELRASDGALVRVDASPADGFDHPVAMALAGGGLWVANSFGGTLVEIDPSNGKVLRRLDVSAEAGGTVALLDTPGGLWAATSGLDAAGTGTAADSLFEVDPQTGAILDQVTTASGWVNAPLALAFAGGDLWVVNPLRQSLTLLQP